MHTANTDDEPQTYAGSHGLHIPLTSPKVSPIKNELPKKHTHI